jgi:phytoene dehydrogenase-like protein
VIANLPPWNIAGLMPGNLPSQLRSLRNLPEDGWGAFVVYVGYHTGACLPETSLHNQVIVGTPLAEGNSVFISISPDWDKARAPAGHRAITLSTHTRLSPWWDLYENDLAGYDRLKADYTDRLLSAAEKVIPGLRQSAELVLPGTPVTFQRFTSRKQGWVGGFPQTHLLRAWPARLAPELWMVGDSIFPGQSTAAVALGGMRVAEAVFASLDPEPATWRSPSTYSGRKKLQQTDPEFQT